MHKYRIVAQISLVLSILNLVLAAPIVVREIPEPHGDVMAVTEDVGAVPKKWRELEVSSDRSRSPRSSPDAMASPQHLSLSDGSTSSGYPAPHLSSDSSDSGYSWLLNRPPRPSPHPASPYHSIPGPSETPPLPLLLQGLPSPSYFSSPGSSEMPPSPQHVGSDWATTETSSPPERFTPSRHPSSLSSWNSDESMSTAYASASGGSLSSHYFSASDGSPPSQPTEPTPGNGEFFNKNMMKKLGIVPGMAIVGVIIGGIVGSQNKHRDCQDS